MTPSWADGAVLYQIYPHAFADANGDGIGDLAGVIARLDHLAGDPSGLGVDAVWLSPIYPHGGVDGGYDVTDHAAVAPEFGSLADLDRLLAECHARRLRVLLDLVTGHTSDRHPWFTAARASRASASRDWYLWADPRPGPAPPTNWVAEFGGSAWSLDPISGQYFHHSFYPEQPDLNWRNPAVRAAMGAAMRFWLDRGVDGFRVDALEFLIKDRRLRDNPPAGPPRPPWSPEPGGLQRRRTRNQPGVAGVLRHLRGICDEYPDRVLLGELYSPALRVAASLGGARGPGLHLALDHQLAKSPWQASSFRRAIAAAERHLAPPRSPTWAFSNHDLSRQATRWGPGRARLAALILLTLRGTVCLYQGEEIGMTDAPMAAGGPDRAGRDSARAPFDWDEAARQRDDPNSLLALYRRLIDLRHTPVMRHGTLELLRGLPTGVLGYERIRGVRRVTVLANMGDRRTSIRLRPGSRTKVLLATHAGQLALSSARVELAPDQGVLLG
ncbi:MAG: alpha-amylase family glycosyl hydrolase [Candidatus Limnocylindria bacterium]